MKILEKHSTVYFCPAVKVMAIEAESVLCASSEELDDLQKNEFDFNWGN